MINLSKLARESTHLTLKDKLLGMTGPEVYFADNIGDYKSNKLHITRPWFKRNPLSYANKGAIVIFYNVGIDGIFEGKALIPDFVNLHDQSGFKVASWTEIGDLFPAEKSYSEMLKTGELKINDWVERLVLWHSYDENLPFVSEVNKNNFKNRRTEKDSLTERVVELFPKLTPIAQLAY